MQRVYEPRDLWEAQMLAGMLEGEGINCHVAGMHLLGALGDLPIGGLLGLLVDDAEAERAKALINAYNRAEPLPGDEPQSYPGDLLC